MSKTRHRGRSAKRKRGSAQPQGIDRPYSDSAFSGACRIELLQPESWNFCGQHFVFWRALISAYPIFLHRIDDDFVPELLASDKKLDRFVCRSVFLLQPVIVDLDCYIVPVPFWIRLEQGKLQVGHAM